MQGRLSDCVDGKIQAFPWFHWQSEFQTATTIGLHLMEWTLDHEHLYQNPLMTNNGQKKIVDLCKNYDVSIPSLTGDCFMQEPFWKRCLQSRTDLQRDFMAIVRACSSVGISMIVIPLVDNGRIETAEQEQVLVDFLLKQQSFFSEQRVKIIFESDFIPCELFRFISRLPSKHFGINYDIGNSAALGFDPEEEFETYGSRVMNVHVKDRVLGGTTVPLKKGSADFDAVFSALVKQNYRGNFILQTARATDENHSQVLRRYRDMTHQWIKQYKLVEIDDLPSVSS